MIIRKKVPLLLPTKEIIISSLEIETVSPTRIAAVFTQF
jgi:hypothetical protein